MHTENIRRVLLTSLAGITSATTFLVGIYFGPWAFTSLKIPLQFLFPLWNSVTGSMLTEISVVGLIFGVLSSLAITLFFCGVDDLLVFRVQFSGKIRHIAYHFILVAMTLLLIGNGLFVSRSIFVLSDGLVLFLSIYETAQSKNWQIRTVNMMPDFLGDYYRTIRFHLADGSTKDCLYNQFFAQEHGYDGIFDFKNISDAQDALSCPP